MMPLKLTPGLESYYSDKTRIGIVCCGAGHTSRETERKKKFIIIYAFAVFQKSSQSCSVAHCCLFLHRVSTFLRIHFRE